MLIAGVLVLAPIVALIALNLAVDSGGLPESAKAPPPALREQLNMVRPAAPKAADSALADREFYADLKNEFADYESWRQIRETLYQQDIGSAASVAKPADAETARSLESHRALLNRFYTWIADGGAIEPPMSYPIQDLYRLALADAEWDWRSGRPGEALTVAQTLFKLFDSTYARSGAAAPVVMRENNLFLSQMLQRWVEQGSMPPEANAALRLELSRLTEREWQCLRSGELFWAAYDGRREKTIYWLETPWYSGVFGFSPKDATLYHETALGIKLPRPGPFIATAWKAIRAKRQAPQILADWDAWNEREIKEAMESPPEALVLARNTSPESFGSFLMDPRFAKTDKTTELIVLYQANIVRTGLAVLADPASGPPSAIDPKSDPNNPWRDPLTDTPLKMEDRDGRQAIYSPVRTDGGLRVHLDLLESEDAILLLPAGAAASIESQAP